MALSALIIKRLFRRCLDSAGYLLPLGFGNVTTGYFPHELMHASLLVLVSCFSHLTQHFMILKAGVQ